MLVAFFANSNAPCQQSCNLKFKKSFLYPLASISANSSTSVNTSSARSAGTLTTPSMSATIQSPGLTRTGYFVWEANVIGLPTVETRRYPPTPMFSRYEECQAALPCFMGVSESLVPNVEVPDVNKG